MEHRAATTHTTMSACSSPCTPSLSSRCARTTPPPTPPKPSLPAPSARCAGEAAAGRRTEPRKAAARDGELEQEGRGVEAAGIGHELEKESRHGERRLGTRGERGLGEERLSVDWARVSPRAGVLPPCGRGAGVGKRRATSAVCGRGGRMNRATGASNGRRSNSKAFLADRTNQVYPVTWMGALRQGVCLSFIIVMQHDLTVLAVFFGGKK